MITATQALRESTRARHAALERVPIARDLMSPRLAVPLEVPCLLPPRRAQLAREDLGYWQRRGYAVAPGAAGAEGLIGALHPAEIPGFLGVCYVARGASLGSRVIAAHLRKVLLGSPGAGIPFFAHDGDTSLPWPQWSRHLEARLVHA